MSDQVRVTCSDNIPDAWHVMLDAEQATRAIVMLAPAFRVIYGDPCDERITELRISTAAMARHAVQQARIAALRMWEPAGRMQ